MSTFLGLWAEISKDSTKPNILKHPILPQNFHVSLTPELKLKCNSLHLICCQCTLEVSEQMILNCNYVFLFLFFIVLVLMKTNTVLTVLCPLQLHLFYSWLVNQLILHADVSCIDLSFLVGIYWYLFLTENMTPVPTALRITIALCITRRIPKLVSCLYICI